jgi:carbonic anhydrase
MSTSCTACVVTCEDYRLHGRGRVTDVVAKIVRQVGGPCDLVTRRGAVQDLLRGEPGFAESVFRDLEVCVNLHGIHTIYLLNHAGCGAYGAFKFADREEERRQHEQDLREASAILRKRFPKILVVPMFAVFRSENCEDFLLQEVPEVPAAVT